MNRKQLKDLGIPGTAISAAFKAIQAAVARDPAVRDRIGEIIQEIVSGPQLHLEDDIWGAFARQVIDGKQPFQARQEPAPWHQWGGADVDDRTVDQLRAACELPVSVAGALMPDAHLGYGLPIGGVLATEGAVIPYAVGVDIACRMKMTVLDLPASLLEEDPDRLQRALERETRFGIGACFKKQRRQHEVLDADWSVSPVTRKNKDRAWKQLGTSGSGNHFVEFGMLDVPDANQLGLSEGRYLALLSHSGSRGTGAAVCSYYSRLAAEQQRGLPKRLANLAWLDLETQAGQEYWAAMNLMGEYAAANHACIHRHVARHLSAAVLADFENHHNFAWEEEHHGRRVIVHRKGATPAGLDDIGIIPGTMADTAFLVRGKGDERSLHSASHGAGRRMSRREAKRRFNWNDAKRFLAERKVKLLSAGLDEVPMAYKDIHAVMADQADLVQILARFTPRMVKMAPAGERPED